MKTSTFLVYTKNQEIIFPVPFLFDYSQTHEIVFQCKRGWWKCIEYQDHEFNDRRCTSYTIDSR